MREREIYVGTIDDIKFSLSHHNFHIVPWPPGWEPIPNNVYPLIRVISKFVIKAHLWEQFSYIVK